MLKKIVYILVLIAALYGGGRLYYGLTDGFTIGNMTADFPYHSEWETHPLSPVEQQRLDEALNQSYTYLGKGCQAYVFESKDGKYVVKFFKYQRFRLKPWEEYIPFYEDYRKRKLKHKQEKLERFLLSWVVAYNDLKEETGLVFVHLNKTTTLNHRLSIQDKLGLHNELDLDQLQFCIQRKAEMLATALLRLKAENKLEDAKQLAAKTLNLLINDYKRGFVDNDPALMQNTGVVDGNPIHVDIGQLVHDEQAKNPDYYKPLYDAKAAELHRWLQDHYPEAM